MGICISRPAVGSDPITTAEHRVEPSENTSTSRASIPRSGVSEHVDPATPPKLPGAEAHARRLRAEFRGNYSTHSGSTSRTENHPPIDEEEALHPEISNVFDIVTQNLPSNIDPTILGNLSVVNKSTNEYLQQRATIASADVLRNKNDAITLVAGLDKLSPEDVFTTLNRAILSIPSKPMNNRAGIFSILLSRVRREEHPDPILLSSAINTYQETHLDEQDCDNQFLTRLMDGVKRISSSNPDKNVALLALSNQLGDMHSKSRRHVFEMLAVEARKLPPSQAQELRAALHIQLSYISRNEQPRLLQMLSES